MSNVNELFNIKSYNLVQDEDYYYLFRALNNGDHEDLETGNIRNTNGKIVKIRTDRARYIENSPNAIPKYEEYDSISLLQVIDHIKEHHRYDTNCISLSSNANVSIMYGNGYYADEYTVIRVPKNEIGTKVINAGEYMLEEMNVRIKEVMESTDNEGVIDLISRIDEASSREELLDIIASSYKLGKTETERFTGTKDEVRKKITFRTRFSEYTTLSNEQNLLKNKIIAKLTILEERHLMEPIMPHTSIDSKAIATLGLAFSSRELLHYGEIEEKYIFEASKEFIHMLGLLQQSVEKKPEFAGIVHQMENEIIGYIVNGYRVTKQNGQYVISNGNNERIIEIENDNVRDNTMSEPAKISVKQAYELTHGRINFQETQEMINKIFYLSKSIESARQYSNTINILTGKNPKYVDVIETISNMGIDIEPKLMDKKSKSFYKICESVSIGLSRT